MASIFTIGVFELVQASAAWVIALSSVLGAKLLASILLIRETQLAVADVREESRFLPELG